MPGGRKVNLEEPLTREGYVRVISAASKSDGEGSLVQREKIGVGHIVTIYIMLAIIVQ